MMTRVGLKRQGASQRGFAALWLGVVLVLLVAAALRFYDIHHTPPGFHYDEGAYFIASREIAFFGARPFPVFAAFNGREVFYLYVNALMMRLMGEQIFTMHFVSGMMNLVTVAATLGLGRAIFGGRRGIIIGLVAAAFLTVSFPQIFLARQAFRAVSQPMLQALTLWALFVGLRQPFTQHRKWSRWLVMAGILGAATLYTYMASRLFPIWIGLILAFVWLADREQRRTRFLQAALVIVTLLIVAAPILKYYYENQDVFNDRLSQLSSSEDAPSYWESIELHAKMFFIKGDPYSRYNDSDAPYFPQWAGVLIVIGWLVSLWRIIRPAPDQDAVARTGYFLAAIAPLMVIPSVLALNGLPPSHMRSVGMVPAIFLLPAIGLEFLWEQSTRLLSANKLAFRPQFTTATYGIGVIGLLIMAGVVWQRYEKWATVPELYYQTDGDMLDAGAWLMEHRGPNTIMYVTSGHYDHPSLRFRRLPGGDITFLLGNRVFAPPANRDAYLIEIHNARLNESLREWVEQHYTKEATFYGPDGDISFVVYHAAPSEIASTTAITQSPTLTHAETIGRWLSLLNTNLVEAVPGQTVSVFTEWGILNPPAYGDLTPIFSLETLDGDVLSRDEPYTLYSDQWRTGETLYQQGNLSVPPGTPPGEYRVVIHWVARAEDQYVGRIDAQGNFAGIATDLGIITVSQAASFPTPDVLNIAHRESHDMTSGVRLLGWSDIPASIRPGEQFKFDLFWQAITGTRSDETIMLVAVSENDELPLWSGEPATNTYPFSQWADGELVTDRHRWSIPTDFPAGKYDLHLRVGDTDVVLGNFSVLELNRVFDVPAIENPLDVDLGNIVGLTGYSISTTTLVPGQSFDLTLLWQSLEQTDLPLTVFVHVMGPDGRNYAQADMQPRQNTYPVTLWLPGEYITDAYPLTLAADAPLGQYEVRVGLYLQANGQRLSITDSTGQSVGDFWLLTTLTVE
ncbi:MAG: glycosyltransferase family 39 protein [Anaerolineae bacterium]|nr:glycosyltransferase family 39 protein [Anaerolineae bacterium]